MIEMSVTALKSFKAKSIGLIGSKKAFPVLCKTRFGIHTFGMNFPIDVVILDKKNAVAKLKKNLLPNNIFLWSPKFDTVLELPAGEIEKHNVQIGEKIKLNLIGKK